MSERFKCDRQLATSRNHRIWTATMESVNRQHVCVAHSIADGLSCPVLPGPASTSIRQQPSRPGRTPLSFRPPDRPTLPHPAITANPDATWNLRLLAASLLALGQSLVLSDGHGCYCFLLAISTTKSIEQILRAHNPTSSPAI